MSGKKIGMNLLMCIPPDHQRNDLPSSVKIWQCQSATRYCDGTMPVYIRITDDLGNTVTLPCFDYASEDGRFILMAHRTGRPLA